jgi:hypothetical protein
MTENPNISPAIAALLGRLRTRIRAYVWLEGMALVVAALGAAFWLGLALDWVVEPSPAVRTGLMVLVGVGLLVLVYRTVLRRAFVPLADVSLAILLERYARNFDDSLLTAVELANSQQDLTGVHREMLAHTSEEATSRVAQVHLSDVFNFRPLVRCVVAAAVMLVSVGLFAYFAHDAFGFYVDRLQLSQERWPRSTRLTVEGFPADADGIRRIKVAKGGNYTLLIQADTSSKYKIPQRVEVLYTLDDGSRGRGDAKRIGNSVPGRDAFQEFQFTFENLHDSHTFDVVGRDEGVILGLRDERIRGLKLDVVESPGVIQKLIDVVYPAYMQRTPATLEATAAMQLPRGSKLTIHATSNKPLVSVHVDDSALEHPVEFKLPADQKNLHEFTYSIPTLAGDRVLLFALTDKDGITTADQDRDRLSILAVEDESPQVTVRLQGIGEAITPSANVPLTGKLVDDYGVAKAWFEHLKTEGEVQKTPLTLNTAGRQDLLVAEALDVRPLELQPSQTLTLWLKAEDKHDLDTGPNAGSSTRFELKVVTPEDLRGLLDRDELRLRQRFEAVYEEMLRTRELLARVEFGAAAVESASPKAADETASEAGSEPENSALPAEKPAVDEKTAKPADPAELAERSAARRRLQLMKALHYIERGEHDTLSVATGFDEIFAQMINNRIDSVDAKGRLVSDIADPLRSIGNVELKQLTKQLEELRTLPVNDEMAEAKWRASLTQTDEVLVAMKQVLDRMQRIGNFNELVDMFRSILKDQDQLNTETKEQRVKTTRSLLED